MIAPADDLDRIMAVMDAAFDPAFGEAWTRRQVEDALLLGGCRYLLIAPDGQTPGEGGDAAGFALLRALLDEEELLLFAVDPRWRRRGLGARLLTTALASARDNGIARMLLEMRQGNPAQNLYGQHGFVQIGSRPRYYRAADGQRLDAITFACLLEA